MKAIRKKNQVNKMEKKIKKNLVQDTNKKQNRQHHSKQSKYSYKEKNIDNGHHISLQPATDATEEIQKKWFEMHDALLPISTEVIDMKDDKLNELHNSCRSAFEQEKTALLKKNRKDASWLQTALRKGTAKDSANAGVLLVISNPLANLDALDQLISFTKLSNKASTDVMPIILDMWMNVLLPSHRKLYSLQMRGADWKVLRANESITNEMKREIYAYWYFEAELKERYSEFLKNIQQSLQNGQEINKTVSIMAASQLLIYAPEKESMLLAMLINKLGDPIAKVSSKALHHLIDIATKHPNMCSVIVNETEKLLFRNNISEKAQHMALCYLGSVASLSRTDVCIKLVNVCFALFKVLVQKGAVNNRTMQAILRCLQKTIAQTNAIQENNTHDKKSNKDKDNDNESKLLNPDMLDTIYRLVHLADIRISIQTLGLLLQLQSGVHQKGDRFYNALYAKLLDVNVPMIGMKTAAQFLHIIHRAIHIDRNVVRAKAFIKRLLQLALYVPSNIAAGCLIVIRKLLSSRKELNWWRKSAHTKNTTITKTAEITTLQTSLQQQDMNGNNNDNDGRTDNHEEGEKQLNVNDDEISKLSYNPYHRVPHYSGIQFTINDELLLLRKHFHPTIQVFAENILTNKKIDYYGDPLRDFGLPHFLERFSFKNPKKIDQDKKSVVYAQKYKSIGARGLPLKMLTKANCTEDEIYIFNYLELKRQKLLMNQSKEKSAKHETNDNDGENDDDHGSAKVNDVSDDEFDEYLNNYFRNRTKRNLKDEEEELDFMKELGDELSVKSAKQKKQKKKKISDDDIDDIEADWEADNNDDDEQDNIVSDNDEDYMSLDEESDSDLESQNGSDSAAACSSDSQSETDDPKNLAKSKETKKRQIASFNVDDKAFTKKLKHSTDMRSLFAAADDFGELLEEAGKIKGQGTANAIFNQDKSSEKQLKWEEKRHSNRNIFHHTNKNKKAKKISLKKKVQSRKIK